MVIGGIYAGLFSPTEAAAVGAGGALLFAGIRKKLNWATLRAGIRETAGMTGMIFLILIGAALFNFFIETSGLTVVPAFNVITGVGYDPVWFGVLLVSVVEIGLITPPIGMNLFIIQGVSSDMTITTLSRGILPFLAADIVRVVLMVAIPGLILWLPHLLGFGAY